MALMGKDICGGAVTGSGKTAAFVVPVLERLLYRSRQTATSRVLILCPTRELAIQCHSVAQKLASFTDITFGLCVGKFNLTWRGSIGLWSGIMWTSYLFCCVYFACLCF